ncbi:hypothetical protein SESBI_50509 [Sesbania bispinosa]|nr:hypothetical protein SESBI_50509 [Sesbania bispinosa]
MREGRLRSEGGGLRSNKMRKIYGETVHFTRRSDRCHRTTISTSLLPCRPQNMLSKMTHRNTKCLLEKKRRPSI